MNKDYLAVLDACVLVGAGLRDTLSHPDEFLVNQFYLDDALVTLKPIEQAGAIGRTLEDQLRAFHKTGALPLFSQTVADALSIELDPPIEGSFR